MYYVLKYISCEAGGPYETIAEALEDNPDFLDEDRGYDIRLVKEIPVSKE